MNFTKKTVIVLDFNDLPRDLMKDAEPPNGGYMPVSFHRFFNHGETLKDLWSYEEIHQWKFEFYSLLLAKNPEHVDVWGKFLTCSAEDFLQEEHPIQAYLMTQLTPEDVDGVTDILIYCDF